MDSFFRSQTFLEDRQHNVLESKSVKLSRPPLDRHARESGHPEVFEIPGFRLALAIASLAGMTSKLFNGVPEEHNSVLRGLHEDKGMRISRRGRSRVFLRWSLATALTAFLFVLTAEVFA